MTKKHLFLSSLLFVMFAGIPLGFSLFQGNMKDSVIISLILIAVLGVTLTDYLKNKRA
ncbi:hypothetical protein [Rossellomorea marisflavi]|uniref:hypothetical protein n=1 Tax=Rossellomorea TaxID=2837508 RepID=UPI000AC4FE17|nr:hypothetical protein [Rossellomorea marisflavi]QHA38131.1 hypothetical protein D5E69_21680 [Rossellomorea marisflavi]USK92054.1 hypothetical protein LIT29_21680 [Rossellomorea marisflavi]VXB44907.1 hypothetical protein BACI349Y_330033 [Bacillus sp. 349Y]